MVTAYTYNKTGTQETVTDSLGRVTSYTYNELNRVVAVTNPLSGTTVTTYDATGNRAATTDAEGRATAYGYDTLNRVVTTTNALGGQSITHYDEAGRRAAAIDANGHATTFEYDSLGRLLSTTDAESQTTSIQYNALGQRTSVTDAEGNATSYTYDSLGRILTTTNPLSGTTGVSYNALGNQIQIVNPKSAIVNRQYDDLNRLTQSTNANGLTAVTASVPGVEVTVNGYSNQVAPNGQGSISITGQKASDTVGQGSVSIHGFYRALDDDRIAYTLNPSSFTQPDLQPGQLFSKQYVLTPTLFDEGTNYTLSLSDPDMVEQWISLSGPGSVTGGNDALLTINVTPPVWLQEGHTYAYSASITLTDPDQQSRTGTLHFEVSKNGAAGVELHTAFEPGPTPMTAFSLNARGDINARIIECEEGEDEKSGGDGGGWTWDALGGGGGFRGRQSGGDDSNSNSGSGGGDNPTTGADGTPAETTGEESQEVSLGLSQSLMLDGESFQATLTLNSIVTPTVQNITVTLLISDASGADARNLFTIVPVPPTDLGDLPGGGQVIGDWLIVPTVEVTRSEGEDFRIRAQLDYDYEGQAYRFTTIEETITVFPAPELIIDYELPEADLVCTTFDLRATIHNEGAGPARNLRLTGGQPRITQNTGNTPQSFKVTRVAVNGEEVGNATMALDLGDIPPGDSGEVVWRIEAEEAGRFVDFSSDYRMLNYLGEALAPSLRGINTTFAPPSDPFEYGCMTGAFSISGYVRDDNDTPIPGITVASASGRTAVTNADGYYILPGLVTGTYTIVPTQTGYTFLPETGAASVPPSQENVDFTATPQYVDRLFGNFRGQQMFDTKRAIFQA